MSLGNEARESEHRLPRTVTPSRYDLRLEVDLQECRFTGTADVDVEVHADTDEVVLNAVDLDITSGSFTLTLADQHPNRSEVLAVAEISLDAERERAVLRLDGTAPPGAARLHLAFSGELDEQLRGFYLSTFTDAEGTERRIATTQFESTNARRAFPCWDEPDLKAVFALTLVVPDGLMAISSGAETASRSLGDGRCEVEFAPTMRMSTYLLAFVVGPLEATEPVDVNGTPLRVVHPVGKGHLAGFALEAGAFALKFFEDYFAIPYPGGKLDLVAVPDFAFGAMENLGCVTFREVLLMLDPASATQPEQQTAATVIAHEIAHMWFGDLVTMRWWNGLWLKEAFATFCELLAVDAFRPEWQRWLAFGLSRSAALDVDALAATRPVEYPVASPADAEGMYDLLTYEKGAAVVRMLEQYLGAEAFREGVRLYLRKHAYSNTETHDLWDAFAEVTGEPVREIMESWIFQGGFPAITVTGRGSSEGITLRQQRFRLNTTHEQVPEDPQTATDASAPDSPLWRVPITARTQHDDKAQVRRHLMEQPELRLGQPPGGPLMLNHTAEGFYRVYYPEGIPGTFSGEKLELSPLELYVLLDDLWAFTVAGWVGAREYVDWASRHACGTDLTLWQKLAGSYAVLDHLVSDAGRPTQQQIVRSTTRRTIGELGWDPVDGEDDRTRELRGVLLRSGALHGGDAEFIERGRRLLDQPGVDPALQAAAVDVVAAYGSAEEYEEFRRRFAAADTPQLERRYLMGLARFEDPELMDRTLAATLDGTIRSQDAGFVLQGCLEHRSLGPQVWEFVTGHWEEILQRLPTAIVPRMLGGVRALSHPALAEEVTEFCESHPVPSAGLIVAQHLERLRVNVAFRRRVQDELG